MILFYIGEGETVYYAADGPLYKASRKKKMAKTVKHFYMKQRQLFPEYMFRSLYNVDYNKADGTVESFLPVDESIPAKVTKQVVMNVTDAYYPTKPVVPYIQAIQDRVVLEILRGCIRGCRFCQAGAIYRPTRERDVEKLKQYAIDLIKNTGL